MYLLKTKLFIISVVAFCSITCAEKIAVLLDNVTGLTEQDGEVVCAVIGKSYGSLSKMAVFDYAGARKVYLEKDKQIVQTAKLLQAYEYIVVSAIALEEKIMIDAVRYDNSGQEVFRSEVITAITKDDLPEISDRLARILYNKATLDKTITSENVTKIETQEKNRVFTEKIIGCKVGIVQPIDKDSSFQQLINIGFHLKAEARKCFIEFGAGALLPTHFGYFEENRRDWAYGGVNLEMGAAYYLTNNPTASLFLGGGFNPRILFEPGVVVVTPYIDFGVMLLRYSSMRIFSNVRIAQNVFAIPFERYIYNEQSWEGYYQSFDAMPFEIGLELGIGW